MQGSGKKRCHECDSAREPEAAFYDFSGLPSIVNLLAFGLLEPLVTEWAMKLDILVPQVSVMNLELSLALRAFNSEYPGHVHSPPVTVTHMLVDHGYLFETGCSDVIVEPYPPERFVWYIESL